MTSPTPIPEAEKGQEKYLASQSQWQDMKRNGEFTITLVLLMAIATLYSLGYAIDQFERWLFTTTSQTLFNILLLRIVLIVLTPMLLLFIGRRFSFRRAVTLVEDLYAKTDEKIPALIRRRLVGVPPLPPPLNGFVKYESIIISPDKPDLDEHHWARWLGGPATLVIYDGFAVYLERGNQFSRVVGPGFPPPFLERYEHIKEIIDLRPQTKSHEVKPWTKDGIPITLTVKAKFRIDASAKALERSSTVRYPFDPVAVKAAVEYASVCLNTENQPQEQSWLDAAWGPITGAVNSFVSGHSLDELFVAPRTEDHANIHHLNSETPEHIEQIFSQTIAEQVTSKARESLHPYGIHVSDIQITKLEVHADILDLRTRYWETIRLKIAAQHNSRAEADHIRARELAHAEAQRIMLTTIMTKLEKVDSKDLTEALALSLSGILDQNLEDPLIRPLIAKESFAVLDRVKKLLHDRF